MRLCNAKGAASVDCSMNAASPQALMSIDVEDWFQVENLRGAISRDSWDRCDLRVEKNVDLILSILDGRKIKATFFVLGWIAERLPQLVRRIQAERHEIASHGYGHDLIYALKPEAFVEDIRKSKRILEDLAGQEVVGYRAPSFSITDWAIDALADAGFKYDSSLFASMAHDRYGRLSGQEGNNEAIFQIRRGFHQVRLSCLRLGGRNVPWAGGGYFRLYPYPIFRKGVAHILQHQRIYCFYIHPWEFDPEQPKVRNLDWTHRFRHYNNLTRTESRFRRMVREFHFQPIRQAIPPIGQLPQDA